MNGLRQTAILRIHNPADLARLEEGAFLENRFGGLKSGAKRRT
jgi:hypothetical protein